MEQLLLHLVGDYLTQTHWMASRKRDHPGPAAVHAVIYALPFMLLPHSSMAWWTICLSHFLIDHFGLARYVVFAKNWASDNSLRWRDCRMTGYPPEVPTWMAVWLTIVADNTLHLGINYLALRYL